MAANSLIPSADWPNFINTSQPRINDLGQLAFIGVTPTFQGIMTRDAGGEFREIALTKSSAPGTDGENFYNLVDPAFNDAGNTAFWGTSISSDESLSSTMGIWSDGRGQGLELVASFGELAPGMTDGTVFDHLGHPALSGNGRLAFPAFLAGPDGSDESRRSAIWAQDRNFLLRSIALQGEAAPGAAIGELFGILYHASEPAINAIGQVAFRASVRDARKFGLGQSGIWALDVSGTLQCIILEGQQLDVDNGPGIDLRTVSWVEFLGRAGTEDGRPSGINDFGQIAFMARFSDGSSGVFVSDKVAIPEPRAVVLLVVGSCGWPRRRFGRR